MCFVRPIGIVPKVNRYRRRLRHNDKPHPRDGQVYRKYSVFRYQWDGHPQMLPQWSNYGLPTRDGTIAEVTVWDTKLATPEQQALISVYGSEAELPDTGFDTPEHSAIKNSVSTPIRDPAEVVTEQVFYISGFNGIKLLRSCKQVRTEGTEILYGHNDFFFDADCCNGYRDFEREADEVPGAPLLDGTLPTENQISEGIAKLFNKKFRHCNSIWYDNFFRFFVAIGPHNAARLRSVDITGTFKVDCSWSRRLSFASILPVYTTLMNRVCHNLTKITLHKNSGDDTWAHPYNENDYDDNGHEIEGIVRPTDDERISDAVEKMVKGLPRLKQLQLGSPENGNEYGVNFQSSSGLHMDEGWGSAMEWVQFVEDRVSGDHSSNQDTAVAADNGNVEEAHQAGTSSPQIVLDSEIDEDVGRIAEQLASAVL